MAGLSLALSAGSLREKVLFAGVMRAECIVTLLYGRLDVFEVAAR